MKIVIIGGVAAGTSAAAKARRNSEEDEIIILEQGGDISYSSCGLPYYIGGEVSSRGELTPRDVDFFKKRYNIDVKIKHEVLNIEPDKQLLKLKNLISEKTFSLSYDRLIICTGAKPIVPDINGINLANIYPVRSVASVDPIYHLISQGKVKQAVVIGAGFIGLEMCEALVNRGIKVSLVEKANQLMPNMDVDIASWIESELQINNIDLFLNCAVSSFEGDESGVKKVCLSDGQSIQTDLVILAIGIKPNVALAEKAGIKIGITGAIQVNQYMETNIANIYAAGDCIENISRITGQAVYQALGSTANKTGRLAGQNASGQAQAFEGVLGTSIAKFFNLTIGKTGLSAKEAIEQGFDILTAHNIKPNQQKYYKGGQDLLIKSVADKKTSKLIGAQIIGGPGVDKRLDVLATSIYLGANMHNLFQLDLAYSPPYSTTKDPVAYTGMIMENQLFKQRPLMNAESLHKILAEGEEIQIIDVRDKSQYGENHVPTAINLELGELRNNLNILQKDLTTIVYCNSGTSGNAAQNILINNGFNKCFNLSGGYKNWSTLYSK